MRLGLAAALTAVALFALVGCSQPQQVPEATSQPAISTPTFSPSLSSLPTRIPTPVLISTPTLAPSPTPTVPPTSLPIATSVPQPTETPGPSTTSAPTGTPVPTATPELSATSVPEGTPVPTATSVPESTPVPKELSLDIEPDEPYSGRDALFTLQGLDPWEKLAVQFFDPNGKPAEWVSEYESYLTDVDENPVTERSLYADNQGQASWLRIGTKDQAGIWKVQITRGDTVTNMAYTVNRLPVTPTGSKTIGVNFRLYQGPVSNTYYTDKVPGALTVDLQAHLKLVTDELLELAGLRGEQTPNIYLVDNLDLLKQVSESSGSQLGFADGYYHSGGDDSGVYMHTDSLLTGIQRLLTHEYVHLALSDTIGPVELPAWLNEGTATYFEYLLNAAGERADATKHPLYRSIGLAESAARSDNLLPLTGLESQETWNSQTEKAHISLQYAQSHMAVRYLANTYGNTAPIDIMKRMGTGATLPEAFVEIVGIQYSTFEERFTGWLQSWEDPKRSQVSRYTQSLNEVMSTKAAIGDRRSEDLASGATPAERLVTKRGLAVDAEELSTQAGKLTPPPELQPLQDEIKLFMERFVTLLTLEVEHLMEQEYLSFLGDVISSVDSISKARTADIRGGAAPSQRVTTKQGLVSDAAALVQLLNDSPSPPSLKSILSQELAFLDQYIRFLTLELEQQKEEIYLRLVSDIVLAIDDISARRSQSLQNDGSSSQRITTGEALVSDAESLLNEMDSLTPPARLQSLQLQGSTYLNAYIQWLTLELEYAQSSDAAKLDQANGMIAEINSGRNGFQSNIADEGRAQPNQNEANDMLGGISDKENLLVQAINAGFRNSAALQQANDMLGEINAREANVRSAISDLEFVYNLREP